MTQIPAILWDACGLTGLLSVAASASATALLVIGLASGGRFRAWLAAAVLAAVATCLANVTSGIVRSIEVDRSAEVLAAEAAGAQAARDRLRSRAADVRFAEDTAVDRADVAGVTVAEEEGAYERAVAEQLAKIPAYRRDGRRERSRRKPAAGEQTEVDSTAAEETAAVPARTLPETQLQVADRFDRINRGLALSLLSVAIALVGCEWVRRFNTTFDTVWPLPLAGTALDGLVDKQHVVTMPPQARANLPRWLESITRKGESFLVFVADDPLAHVPTLPRFSLGPLRWMVPVWSFSANRLVTDPALAEVVFESAWFGRANCVIGAGPASDEVLAGFVTLLAARRRCRAVARRTVTIAWLLPTDPPAGVRDEIERLAIATNVRWVR